MADRTKIEWTRGDDGSPGATWNPVTGCTRVSAGCENCYIEHTPPFRIERRYFTTRCARCGGAGGAAVDAGTCRECDGEGFVRSNALGSTTGVRLHPERLDQPLRWRKPRRIFVNSLSDLFHSDVPDEYIARVFAVMALAPQHTFQVLTKRHGRMRSLLSSPDFMDAAYEFFREGHPRRGPFDEVDRLPWPLPNVWLGVTVEDQKRADLRIPALLDTPAAVRFLSCEPLIGEVDLSEWLSDDCTCAIYVVDYSDPERYHPENLDRELTPGCPAHDRGIDWVICGGESGPDARPMHPDWARSLRDQCINAGVPFLFKQWGEWAPHRLDGGTHTNSKITESKWQFQSRAFQPDGTLYEQTKPDLYHAPGMATMLRVGKRNAGRELDGQTWDQYPEAE